MSTFSNFVHMKTTFCKIAAAVPRVFLADVDANEKEITRLMKAAAGEGAQLVVFPELAVTGATCGDLMFQDLLMDKAAEAEARIRAAAAEIGIAVILHEDDCVYEGITVIQDARAEEVTGWRYLRYALANESKGQICIYCSAGYGESTQDGVYSGAAAIFKDEKILAENERFQMESSIIYADINEEGTVVEPYSPEHNGRNPFIPEDKTELALRCDEILSIQTLGLCSRISHIHSKTAVIGISGGLDSTLALLVSCMAFDRLGMDRKGIIAVTMPGFGTTGRTKNNARNLMERLGVTSMEISIVPAVSLHFKDIGHDPEIHDATYENSQARERTQILMDLANQHNGLVVGTGDLSELALGWATYNGDHMSMYGVNCSVPKTMMQAIVRYCAEVRFPQIKDTLLDIVDTPISPELTPANENGEIKQKTEDLVGPYELHDFFLYHFVRHGRRPSEILELAKKTFGADDAQKSGNYDAATIEKWLRTFIRRFFSQQFKRSCAPDGPKTGSVCLSPRGAWDMPSDAYSALWLSDLD